MIKTIQQRYEEEKRRASDIHEHLPTLMKYAKECGTIVELGVRDGWSTVAFLNARPKWMRSFDIRLTDVAKEIAGQAKAEGIDYELTEADDRKMSIPECELLFIDTWHVGIQLETELRMHADKAKKYIILHDTESYAFYGEDHDMQGLMFGLIRFLDEEKGLAGLKRLFKRQVKWKVKEHFTNNSGLTVLERA